MQDKQKGEKVKGGGMFGYVTPKELNRALDLLRLELGNSGNIRIDSLDESIRKMEKEMSKMKASHDK